MFSSQVFQEGQMHFQFITHWTREHAELEDFQPHRRIFGVSNSRAVKTVLLIISVIGHWYYGLSRMER
jgi:hypothetical protein